LAVAEPSLSLAPLAVLYQHKQVTAFIGALRNGTASDSVNARKFDRLLCDAASRLEERTSVMNGGAGFSLP